MARYSVYIALILGMIGVAVDGSAPNIIVNVVYDKTNVHGHLRVIERVWVDSGYSRTSVTFTSPSGGVLTGTSDQPFQLSDSLIDSGEVVLSGPSSHVYVSATPEVGSPWQGYLSSDGTPEDPAEDQAFATAMNAMDSVTWGNEDLVSFALTEGWIAPDAYGTYQWIAVDALGVGRRCQEATTRLLIAIAEEIGACGVWVSGGFSNDYAAAACWGAMAQVSAAYAKMYTVCMNYGN